MADLFTDFPARFDALEEVWLELEDGRRAKFVLEGSWSHKGRQILKFRGTDSISAAEVLAGAWVEVALEDASPLPEGTYYNHDLIGCSVRRTSGELLGLVSSILPIAGNNQLVVTGEHGEFMIPAVDAICRHISIEEKVILVDLPEGLIDLNK